MQAAVAAVDFTRVAQVVQAAVQLVLLPWLQTMELLTQVVAVVDFGHKAAVILVAEQVALEL
jgi:hypothetical protein